MTRLINIFSLSILFFLLSTSHAFSTPIKWDGNNNYYDIVYKTDNWTSDLVEASLSEYNGMKGYLATITSLEENTFILNSFYKNTETLAFVGGRDLGGLSQNPPSEDVGKWVWYNGPEDGTQFYQEDSSGGATTGPDNFANWATGQPSRTDIHYLAMSLNSGLWYDTNNGGYTGGPRAVSAYIVEYASPVTEPNILFLLIAGMMGLMGIRAKQSKNT